MTAKSVQFDVIVRKDSKWKKNRQKSIAQLEEEAFWEIWQTFCTHTTLMNGILEQVEQPSALPSRIEKLKQPSADAVLPDIKQEEEWLEAAIEQECNLLKDQAELQDLPGRIYTSAAHQTLQQLKSWLEKNWRLFQRIRGKKRFLVVVESDAVLAEISHFDWTEICARAAEILAQTQRAIVARADGDESAAKDGKLLLNALLKQYDSTNDVLERRAIIHLLRNKHKVRRKPENPEKVEEWLEGKRVEVERLEQQVPRLPRLRNLFPDQAYDALLEDLVRHPLSEVPEAERKEQLFYYRVLIYFFLIYTTDTKNSTQMAHCLLQQVRAECESMETLFFEWHDSISGKINEFLKLPKSLPYPIYFGGSDLRSWHLNEENKICFKLNGLGNYVFEVRCDRRQLGLVKYFLEDWQTQAQSENQEYSGSFTLLRSAELLVKPKRSKQKTALPQADDRQAVVAAYKLSLHCTYDTDYLTRQGLERVRQRKIDAQLKGLNQKRAKLAEQQEQLQQLEQEIQQAGTGTRRSRRDRQRLKQIEKLQQSVQQLEAEIQTILVQPNPKLERLRNSPLFRRPDRPLYAGIANLFVGVTLDLDKHLVVSVVDVLRHKTLTKRNVKQIMGEHYPLLQRYRHLKQEHSRQRQKNQKAGRQQRLSAADLGQQVACAIANGLVALAQQYKVSTIVLPDTQGWREHLYSQLVARARIKCRGCKKAMARYTKEQGKRLHQWDYKRLSQAIATEAQTIGITVLFQKPEFQQDTFQQAAQMAVTVYDSLQSKKKKSQSEVVDSTLANNRR